ncbi:MAG: hypothetical protein HC890_11855 [Chloroflexaceae bacterium]|nr:hypothetical protein [Chloroflexaceae bacterium]
MPTGELLGNFPGHGGVVNTVAIAPSGKTLASGSSDGTIRVWDLSTGQGIRTLSGHSPSVLSLRSHQTVKPWPVLEEMA